MKPYKIEDLDTLIKGVNSGRLSVLMSPKTLKAYQSAFGVTINAQRIEMIPEFLKERVFYEYRR